MKRTSRYAMARLALAVLMPWVAAEEITSGRIEGSLPSNFSNAASLFNTVHSALRQWGSSLNHNGMSFFPVTVPAGEVFYHGARNPDRPQTLEWLAFEIEHAAQFAISIERNMFPPPSNDSRHRSASASSLHGSFARMESLYRRRSSAAAKDSGAQHPLEDPDDGEKDPWEDLLGRGYMHIYRASRDLNLVLIDGMPAAKSPLGTLDSTDYILLDRPVDGRDGHYEVIWQEFQRAQDLCALGNKWGVDGWIRMEAGFEIIYCDFSPRGGLELVSVGGSPFSNETSQADSDTPGGEWRALGPFEWMRAASERYHGLQPGRAEVDFSGMVSSFAFPLKLTNPDITRPDLPRLRQSSREDRQAIRDRLEKVVKDRQGRAWTSIKWQTIVDNIVTRYAKRIRSLAEGELTAALMRSELSVLLHHLFIHFPEDSHRRLDELEEARSRCHDYFLQPAEARKARWTPEDEAIYTAVHTVSEAICTSLFTMRDMLEFCEDEHAEKTAAQVRDMAKDLMGRLGWTTWRECGTCADPMAICFIPMFPYGSKQDYQSPSCRTNPDTSEGYWFTVSEWSGSLGRDE